MSCTTHITRSIQHAVGTRQDRTRRFAMSRFTKRRSTNWHPASLLILTCFIVPPATSNEPAAATTKVATGTSGDIEFGRDIRPLLSDKCFRCHGPDAADREADLRLDVRSSAVDDRGGYAAITPGSLDESEVWTRILSADPDMLMPPPDSHKTLSADEIELLRRWIMNGAEYSEHWSFRSVGSMDAEPAHEGNVIDAMIRRERECQELSGAPEAQPEVLLRRVSLDLTGLPPTIEQLASYQADVAAHGVAAAYETAVEKLLDSPQYGERMALAWMDAARYGDTSVFHADGPRDMWIWRDWVIDSFNNNLPYDQFTIKQLAGDLLPESTLDDKIATAFNRNNASTDEGGAIAEEFRVEYAVDRVKTTSMIWLGLSMECAQCHDHKYDPVSQEEYYKFFAFFNQAADPGMQTRRGNQQPLVEIPKPDRDQHLPGIEAELAELHAQSQTIREQSGDQFTSWLAELSENRQSVDLPGDMVHYFPLDGVTTNKEGKPTNRVADLATEKKTGQVIQPKFEDGKFAQAFRANNKSFIKFPHAGNFERDQPFSYGGWIRPAKKGSYSPFARMQNGGDYRGWDFFMSGNDLAVHLIHKWPNNAIKVAGNIKYEPNEWHHIFMTYDGSTQAAGVRLYFDGQPLEKLRVDEDSLTGSMKTAKPLTVGRRSGGAFFDGLVDEVRIYERALDPIEIEQLAGLDPIDTLLDLPVAERTEAQNESLMSIYLERANEPYQDVAKRLKQLRAKKAQWNAPLTTVMVMNDVEKMRPTYLLNRGQYDSPNEEKEVQPDVPAFLPALPEDAPRNRLGLARWLVDPSHPLTARVTVNRFWQMFFGRGIVESVEDFGSQGTWPSHPELLDWLASDFVGNGWDVKRLVKMIVTSQTYRQSSKVTPESYAADPNNIYHSRGARFRLSGEQLRDQALLLSGLLNPKIGGPGVKPYQPPGLWNEVSLDGNLRFKQDTGDKLYRRSMYIYWKRSAPHPTMSIFDAPTREKCALRRGNTNTPLQALALMNDPQFVEAARFLAERVLKEADGDISDRVAYLYRLVTCREVTDHARDVLTAAWYREFEQLKSSPDRAKDIVSVGERPRDENLEITEHAAWSLVSSMLLNLDESITRW